MCLISSKKAGIIKKIEVSISRTAIVNGVYGSATFTYGNNEFTVIADVYDEEGNRTGSSIMKNGKPYIGSIVSNGRYRDICLGCGASLMEHQLLAICLIPGASDKLLKVDENNVINHKTIARASIEARERKHEYDLQCELYYWGGAEPDESLLENPYVPPCDVRDLEICTSAENFAHGSFIKVLDLYDIAISAHDIPLLKQFIIDKDRVEYAMDLYTKYGAETMTRMFRGC